VHLTTLLIAQLLTTPLTRLIAPERGFDDDGLHAQRHRHSEFIRFLNAVEREVPAGKLIHTVLDNYATHKHPKVLAWLSRHPRWTFHFTPTSASWLNAVENFFSKMTRQRIRRGVFRSIADLQTAINAYLAEHNTNAKPFVWTKSADAILAKLNRLPVPSV
jgi:transposase